MCDPISIGLTLAGTALQGIAQGQVANRQKGSIAASGKKYDEYVATTQKARDDERARQQGFEVQRQGAVGDTLATYSPDAFGARRETAVANRSADYTAPLTGMDFGARSVPNAAPNSAVDSRNAATAGAAKSYSLGEALARAKLDAYGDAQQGGGFAAADNARNLSIITKNARNSQVAEDTLQYGYDKANGMQQDALQSQLNADKSAGTFVGGLGDLLTAGGSLYAMGGGLPDLFGGAKGVITAGGKNASGFLSLGKTPNIGGTGLIY